MFCIHIWPSNAINCIRVLGWTSLMATKLVTNPKWPTSGNGNTMTVLLDPAIRSHGRKDQVAWCSLVGGVYVAFYSMLFGQIQTMTTVVHLYICSFMQFMQCFIWIVAQLVLQRQTFIRHFKTSQFQTCSSTAMVVAHGSNIQWRLLEFSGQQLVEPCHKFGIPDVVWVQWAVEVNEFDTCLIPLWVSHFLPITSCIFQHLKWYNPRFLFAADMYVIICGAQMRTSAAQSAKLCLWNERTNFVVFQLFSPRNWMALRWAKVGGCR